MSKKRETRLAESPAVDVNQSRRKFVTRVGKLAYQAPLAISFSLAMSNEAAASHCVPPGPIPPGCPDPH
jgi:hypothetical protein